MSTPNPAPPVDMDPAEAAGFDRYVSRLFGGASTDSTDTAFGQTRVAKFADKKVFAGEMSTLSFDVWEEPSGIFAQIMPRGEALEFDRFEFVYVQIDRVFGAVYGGIPSARAECALSGLRKGMNPPCNPKVTRRSDPDRSGMDCFNVRIYGMQGTGEEKAALLLDTLKYLDAVLSGRSPAR